MHRDARIQECLEQHRRGAPTALSISLGASSRDASATLELGGRRVHLARVGTDGDRAVAERLFGELDGRVDAFGLGGADLGMRVGERWYPFFSVLPVVRGVRRTPLVDGSGLKTVLERHAAAEVERRFGPVLDTAGRRALLVTGSDRHGLLEGFAERGYRLTCGDLMFGLGLPIPIRSARALRRLVPWMMPVVGRLPLRMLYPTGPAAARRTPRWRRAFDEATVIAGDCHYILRYMPARLDGKIVVTNTTTREDQATFEAAGVRSVITTTPVLDGRSFGTNVLEAALVAAIPGLRPDYRGAEYLAALAAAVDQAGLRPA